jgi:hypothetical protein
VQPIFAAIEPIAAHCEAWSPPCSRTMRTARCRTSGEYRFEVFFVMAPSSQGLEPPPNPARFTDRWPTVSLLSMVPYDDLPHGAPRRLAPEEIRSLVALLAVSGPRQ